MSEPLNYPTRVTLLGCALGLLGAALWPTALGCALLVVSLAFDALDGRIARKFDCVTELGARLDWWTDITIGNVLVIVFLGCGRIDLAGPSIAGLVICQAMTAWSSSLPSRWGGGNIRTSGRALVTVFALVGALHGRL